MLTEEQRERIRINRERALEIKRKKAEERRQAEQSEEERSRKRRKGADLPVADKEQSDVNPEAKNKDDDEEVGNKVTLEPFEEGASEFVSKTEAMKMYCLPAGTLAVCRYEEKANPRHKSWSNMKLYYRSEIRSRARERYGGLAGLVEERKRREEKRFQDDLKRTKNVFGKQSKT